MTVDGDEPVDLGAQRLAGSPFGPPETGAGLLESARGDGSSPCAAGSPDAASEQPAPRSAIVAAAATRPMSRHGALLGARPKPDARSPDSATPHRVDAPRAAGNTATAHPSVRMSGCRRLDSCATTGGGETKSDHGSDCPSSPSWPGRAGAVRPYRGCRFAMGYCNKSIMPGRGPAPGVGLAGRLSKWCVVVSAMSSASPRSLNCRRA